MSENSIDRRSFLKSASALAFTFAVPSWVMGTACGPGGPEKNADWESRATALEGLGEVLTKEAPGKWKEKATPHIPSISFEAGKATVTVPHPMNSAHWITDVYIKDQNGVVLGLKSWGDKGASFTGQEATEAKATFDLHSSTTSVTVYSYCNLHDHWKIAPANVS